MAAEQERQVALFLKDRILTGTDQLPYDQR